MNTDRLKEIREAVKAFAERWPDIPVGLYKAEQHRAELLDEVDRLRDGVRKFLDGDYPQTERPYQCKHGLYWYDTCATCIDDYLFSLLRGES